MAPGARGPGRCTPQGHYVLGLYKIRVVKYSAGGRGMRVNVIPWPLPAEAPVIVVETGDHILLYHRRGLRLQDIAACVRQAMRQHTLDSQMTLRRVACAIRERLRKQAAAKRAKRRHIHSERPAGAHHPRSAL